MRKRSYTVQTPSGNGITVIDAYGHDFQLLFKKFAILIIISFFTKINTILEKSLFYYLKYCDNNI